MVLQEPKAYREIEAHSGIIELLPQVNERL